MFEQENPEVEEIREEELVDQNGVSNKGQDNLDNEDLENGNATEGAEVSEVADNAYLAEEVWAESGVVINMNQVQSIDIPEQFSQRKAENGWEIAIHRWCEVTVNMTASMRKTEVVMIRGDQIIKNGEELLVLHNSPADEYKTKRSTSSLALERDELLKNRQLTPQSESSGMGKT